MFCTSCGAKNGIEANYCKQCGKGLDRAAATKVTEQAFERAMPEDDQVTSLLERAYRARKDGERKAAIVLCQEALAIRQNSTSCHSLLSQLYEQGGEIDLAVYELERVLELNPGSIADRVKLDELRGDVPAVISDHVHVPPHIVLADRAKNAAALDLRVPAIGLACVALMVLGGLFTIQVIDHQSSRSKQNALATTSMHPANVDRTSVADPAPNVIPPGTQANANLSNGPMAGNVQSSALGNQQISPFSGLVQPPIIVETQQPPRGSGMPTFQDNAQDRTPAALPVHSHTNQNAQPVNDSVQQSKDQGDPDIDNKRVRLSVSNGDTQGNSVRPAAQSGGNGSIKVVPSSQTGSDNTSARDGISQTSQSRELTARAYSLEMQQQYKQAGNMYLKALDGAGDETAYTYSRAAWCFRSVGDKTSAMNYYQHGIDEAQKMVTSGKQPETARILIKQCESGIKVCSN